MRLRKGLVNAKPKMQVVRAKGATVVLDGNHGFGQVIGAEGMRQAVGLAREHGVGLCAIRNGTHLGALAYIAAMALPHQMIGITLTITNSSAAGSAHGFPFRNFPHPGGSASPWVVTAAATI